MYEERKKENMPKIWKQNILVVLCVCFATQTDTEMLFDGSLYPDYGSPTKSTATLRELKHRTGGQLFGTFAPNQSQLWLDENGNAELHYCIGNSTNIDLSSVKETFEQTVQMWGSKTCIRFTNVDPELCAKPESLTHGVIHIDTFLYKCCSVPFGNQYWLQGEKKSCQKMCIDPREDRCYGLDIRELISYSLGLLAPMNRPDRDDYISFHPEQMEIKMWPPIPYNSIQRWKNMQKCPANQASVTAPVPYDFLSIRHPLTCQYADSVAEFAVVVSRDRKKQYLMEHRYPSCPDLSHFDIYQTNKAYGCERKFKEDCLRSNKPVPKCLNYGYLKRDCTCACSKYYTGARCETKTGAPDYCFENVWFLNIANVTNRTIYDTNTIGMEVKEVKDAGPDYIFNKELHQRANEIQFLTITVELAKPLKHVNVALNFTNAHSLIDVINNNQDKVVNRVTYLDCGKHYDGFALYWGASRTNHVRTWCLTSFFLNESTPVVLRARVPQKFDMVFRSAIGLYFRKPRLSVKSLLFQLEVSFFGVMNSANPWPLTSNGSNSNGTDPAEGDETLSSDTSAEALLSDASKTGIIGAGVMGIALLIGIAMIAFCGCYCNRDSEKDVVLLDRFDGSSDDGDGPSSDSD